MMYVQPYSFGNEELFFVLLYGLIFAVVYGILCPRKPNRVAIVFILILLGLLILFPLIPEFVYVWW